MAVDPLILQGQLLRFHAFGLDFCLEVFKYMWISVRDPQMIEYYSVVCTDCPESCTHPKPLKRKHYIRRAPDIDTDTSTVSEDCRQVWKA